MRVRISQSNIFPQFDLFQEYKKIEYLISEKPIVGEYNQFGKPVPPRFTLETYVDQLYFSNWELRGTFLSVDEMREQLGIAKSTLSRENVNENLILDFCQYAANIIARVETTIGRCSIAYIADSSYCKMAVENMTHLLGRLGAHFLTDRNPLEICIAYDDELGAVVGSDFPEIKASLTEYKKIDNRGNLVRKGEILCTLYKRLEEVEAKFKGTAYKGICDDTTFLFNKIGVRHWVKKDRIASKTFMTMGHEELELWYDRTYDMFLSCMVISRYLDLRKDIDEIKRTE